MPWQQTPAATTAAMPREDIRAAVDDGLCIASQGPAAWHTALACQFVEALSDLLQAIERAAGGIPETSAPVAPRN